MVCFPQHDKKKKTTLLKYLIITLKNIFTMEYFKQANLKKILEYLITYHPVLSNLYILTYLFQQLSNKILGTSETPLVPFSCKVNNPDFEVSHPYVVQHSILEIHFDLFIHFCVIC